MPERRKQAPVQIGDRLELAVDGLGSGGDGLARIDGYVVLVAGVLPGERALVEITSAAKKYGRGSLVRVLSPSPSRVPAPCRHFLACGGCQLQHLDAPGQLAHKRGQLEQALRHRLGDAAPTVEPMLAPAPYGGRHKVVVHLRDLRGHLEAGFHRARSLELVPITECPASASRPLQLAFAAIRALTPLRLPVWDAEYPGGLLRSVLVRAAAGTDEAHVVVIAAPGDVPLDRVFCDELHAAGATTVSLNVNDGPAARLLGNTTTVLSGPPRIREHLGGIDFLISPDAFFQTSPAGALAALGCVQQALQVAATDVVADLFCGGGLFALPLARSAGKVIGVELSHRGVQDAGASARHNKIANVEFVRSDVLPALASFGRSRPRPSKVVLDPPRDGCGPELVAAIAGLKPSRIAYVACDGRALADDLQVFAANGMRAVRVTPIDMFPQTSHIEAVAVLERGA
jgi:23S rRNA (uracil1939-C5)-methyltransferase